MSLYTPSRKMGRREAGLQACCVDEQGWRFLEPAPRASDDSVILQLARNAKLGFSPDRFAESVTLELVICAFTRPLEARDACSSLTAAGVGQGPRFCTVKHSLGYSLWRALPRACVGEAEQHP